jgi:hypothetical protein
MGKSMNKDVTKKRQQWVKDHPCRFVEECAAPGYRLDLDRHGLLIATVLTIDLFDQPLAWRAKIALLNSSGTPRRIAGWTMPERLQAYEIAVSILAGVGIKSGAFTLSDALSIDLCYLLTPDEAAHVARAAMRPVEIDSSPRLVGEIGRYDFSDKKTQIDGWWNGKAGREEGAYQPQKRMLIYEPGRAGNN